MSKRRLLGLESIKMGDCGADGAMGGSLTALGHFVQESAILTFPEPDKTEIIDEEADEPDLIILTRSGAKNLVFGTRDMETASLIRAFGGSENVDGGWDAPVETFIKEQSVEIKTKVVNGRRKVIKIPKAAISASFDGKFTKKDPGVINYSIDVLTPRDGSDVALTPVHIDYENISGAVEDPVITQSAVNKFTIACGTAGSTIKYTITGLDPSGEYGQTYTTEVTITEDVLVRAVGTKAGMDNSNVVSKIITYSAP